MNKKLFSFKERFKIAERCYFSAKNVGLDSEDLRRIINMFEYSNIEPEKIGNIIKYICVCVEEKEKLKKCSTILTNLEVPVTRLFCKICKNYMGATAGYPTNDFSGICQTCIYKKRFLNRKIEVTTGIYKGKTGVVTAIWYNGDDCSGNYTQYLVSLDNKHGYTNCFGININDIKIKDDQLELF